MTDKNTKSIWSFLTREVWLIGISFICFLFLYVPIINLQKEVALSNQKLDALTALLDSQVSEQTALHTDINNRFNQDEVSINQLLAKYSIPPIVWKSNN